MKQLLFVVAALAAVGVTLGAAEPKRLLVVGSTAGFRHPSVENGESMIHQWAEKSGRATPKPSPVKQ